MPDEFLTVAEVAELLKLNQQTIRNMIDRGELPAVRVGRRRVRFRQTDPDQFLEASSKETEPPAVDERTVTAWTTFGAAMAETTATLERLAEATRALTDLLRADA